MKKKKRISQRERNRRSKQRHTQWEKDHPAEAAELKELNRLWHRYPSWRIPIVC